MFSVEHNPIPQRKRGLGRSKRGVCRNYPMTDPATTEYAGLRETIRSRGGARPLAFLAGISIWAVTLIALLIWLPNPIAAVVPLLVLLATFEVVRSLHLGVERIGRYVQVFVEEASVGDSSLAAPAWERVAMAFGPTVPGAGGHPYFLAVFLLATVINYLAVILPGPVLVELVTMAIPHVAFTAWLIYCDRGMRRQRAGELARFRALKNDSLRS